MIHYSFSPNWYRPQCLVFSNNNKNQLFYCSNCIVYQYDLDQRKIVSQLNLKHYLFKELGYNISDLGKIRKEKDEIVRVQQNIKNVQSNVEKLQQNIENAQQIDKQDRKLVQQSIQKQLLKQKSQQSFQNINKMNNLSNSSNNINTISDFNNNISNKSKTIHSLSSNISLSSKQLLQKQKQLKINCMQLLQLPLSRSSCQSSSQLINDNKDDKKYNDNFCKGINKNSKQYLIIGFNSISLILLIQIQNHQNANNSSQSNIMSKFKNYQQMNNQQQLQQQQMQQQHLQQQQQQKQLQDKNKFQLRQLKQLKRNNKKQPIVVNRQKNQYNCNIKIKVIQLLEINKFYNNRYDNTQTIHIIKQNKIINKESQINDIKLALFSSQGIKINLSLSSSPSLISSNINNQQININYPKLVYINNKNNKSNNNNNNDSNSSNIDLSKQHKNYLIRYISLQQQLCQFKQGLFYPACNNANNYITRNQFYQCSCKLNQQQCLYHVVFLSTPIKINDSFDHIIVYDEKFQQITTTINLAELLTVEYDKNHKEKLNEKQTLINSDKVKQAQKPNQSNCNILAVDKIQVGQKGQSNLSNNCNNYNKCNKYAVLFKNTNVKFNLFSQSLQLIVFDSKYFQHFLPNNNCYYHIKTNLQANNQTDSQTNAHTKTQTNPQVNPRINLQTNPQHVKKGIYKIRIQIIYPKKCHHKLSQQQRSTICIKFITPETLLLTGRLGEMFLINLKQIQLRLLKDHLKSQNNLRSQDNQKKQSFERSQKEKQFVLCLKPFSYQESQNKFWTLQPNQKHYKDIYAVYKFRKKDNSQIIATIGTDHMLTFWNVPTACIKSFSKTSQQSLSSISFISNIRFLTSSVQQIVLSQLQPSVIFFRLKDSNIRSCQPFSKHGYWLNQFWKHSTNSFSKEIQKLVLHSTQIGVAAMVSREGKIVVYDLYQERLIKVIDIREKIKAKQKQKSNEKNKYDKMHQNNGSYQSNQQKSFNQRSNTSNINNKSSDSSRHLQINSISFQHKSIQGSIQKMYSLQQQTKFTSQSNYLQAISVQSQTFYQRPLNSEIIIMIQSNQYIILIFELGNEKSKKYKVFKKIFKLERIYKTKYFNQELLIGTRKRKGNLCLGIVVQQYSKQQNSGNLSLSNKNNSQKQAKQHNNVNKTHQHYAIQSEIKLNLDSSCRYIFKVDQYDEQCFKNQQYFKKSTQMLKQLQTSKSKSNQKQRLNRGQQLQLQKQQQRSQKSQKSVKQVKYQRQSLKSWIVSVIAYKGTKLIIQLYKLSLSLIHEYTLKNSNHNKILSFTLLFSSQQLSILNNISSSSGFFLIQNMIVSQQPKQYVLCIYNNQNEIINMIDYRNIVCKFINSERKLIYIQCQNTQNTQKQRLKYSKQLQQQRQQYYKQQQQRQQEWQQQSQKQLKQLKDKNKNKQQWKSQDYQHNVSKYKRQNPIQNNNSLHQYQNQSNNKYNNRNNNKNNKNNNTNNTNNKLKKQQQISKQNQLFIIKHYQITSFNFKVQSIVFNSFINLQQVEINLQKQQYQRNQQKYEIYEKQRKQVQFTYQHKRNQFNRHNRYKHNQIHNSPNSYLSQQQNNILSSFTEQSYAIIIGKDQSIRFLKLKDLYNHQKYHTNVTYLKVKSMPKSINSNNIQLQKSIIKDGANDEQKHLLIQKYEKQQKQLKLEKSAKQQKEMQQEK